MRYALFLDFDGTLADIAPTPEAVSVEAGLPHTLNMLRAKLGGALAIVSGRRIDSLDRFLAPFAFDAGGLHGLEIRVDGRLLERPAAGDDALRAAATSLRKRLVAFPGAFVEDKEHTLAVHWRLAPEAGPALADVMEEIVAEQAKCEIFSSIDLRDAFHQVALDPESRPITNVQMPGGLWQWTVVPQGINVGPPLLQRDIDAT